MIDFSKYKTIRQIAVEIGVSKQAVQQKINKQPLSASLHNLSTKDNGIIYIHIDGEALIKSAFSKKETTSDTDKHLPTSKNCLPASEKVPIKPELSGENKITPTSNIDCLPTSKNCLSASDEVPIKSAFSEENPTRATNNTDKQLSLADNCLSASNETSGKSAFFQKELTESPSTPIPPIEEMTINYINSLKEQISILTADKEYGRAQIADLQEELKKQSERIADLAEKLVELTRNSQVLLKQEQDKTAFLLPEQQTKRPFWQFWKK